MKKRKLVVIIALLSLLVGCTGNTVNSTEPKPAENAPVVNANVDEQPSTVFYEIFVRSFYDSDGDGIGDLRGVTEKLDYLSNLGVGGIWLMPIQPSPSYHGYDVTDYYGINSDYGTLDDFKQLMEEAHERGIKVIMDLVVNHTSTSHPWFIDSASGKDSEHRDWYTWASSIGAEPTGSSATGGKAWHSKNGDHYLGVFWEGMPDLNFDNSAVREEMIQIGNHWLELGIDGFRIDAAKHIYDDLASAPNKKEITEKNITWWQQFRDGLMTTSSGQSAYLVGEVWEDSSAAVAPYLNDAFDSTFNFGLANQLVQTAKTGKSTNVTMIERMYGLFAKNSNSAFVDAVFLANHDQNRVMTQLAGSVDQAKMAAALLLTMPGNPFIYYGEEIGMAGMKPDERIREPMVWYKDESGGKGQPAWESRKFNPGGEFSVEAQLEDDQSLLKHYHKFIHLRNDTPALRDGTIKSYSVDAPEVMAYIRQSKSDQVLVLHNLSDSSQKVTIEDSYSKMLLSTNEDTKFKGGQIIIPAYTSIVLE